MVGGLGLAASATLKLFVHVRLGNAKRFSCEFTEKNAQILVSIFTVEREEKNKKHFVQFKTYKILQNYRSTKHFAE